jgi:hypothetical protein
VPNWAFFLMRLCIGVAGSALMTWVGWKLGQRLWALLAFVFSTPLIGVAIAKPLVEMVHDGISWMWRRPLDAWNGRYYEFNGMHVRVLEDGGRLWFCAKDVVRACEVAAAAEALPGLRPVGGLKCMSIEAIESLHGTHRGVDLGRFVLWARREVVTPWERKRSGALVPR